MLAVALALAVSAPQDAGSTPLALFERACLATSGDRQAFERAMIDSGGERDLAPQPFFEGAETTTAFTVDGISIELQTFAAVDDWSMHPSQVKT